MPVRKRAVAAAAQLLIELQETGAPAEPVEVTVTDGAVEVRVTVAPARVAGKAPPGGRLAPATACHLTALDRDILDALTDTPQTMGELSRALDHDADSYFRGRVRRLKRLGMLGAEEDGYRRP